MSDFDLLLKRFLHDPVDKPFDIKTHESRAQDYAEIFGISNIQEASGSDIIASCMERSLLPKDIKQEFTEIRHPLSDEKVTITCPKIEEVEEIVKDVFKDIENKIANYDDKKKFFFLWRGLLEELIEKTKDKPYSKFLPLIPADTRIPDHSIWEHIKISSAINASLLNNTLLQNNSLFLFKIGPVQSFISQARKAMDLFNGSFILSYLTFMGITEIVDKYGPTAIIYPDLFSQPLMDWHLENIGLAVKNSVSSQVDTPTIPNRFVAIIPETEHDKIAKVADAVKQKVNDKWNEIAEIVFKEFNIPRNEKIRSHIQDFPEIYWVAIPWRKGDKDVDFSDLSTFVSGEEIKKLEDLWGVANSKGKHKANIGLLYQLLYTALEKSMGSRKNLRTFNQIEEEGKKCSICGEKEAIIIANTGSLKVGKFISKKEGLCGLCFVKRGFEEYFREKIKNIELSFPSTAEVALSDFKEKALEDGKEEFNEYVERFREICDNHNCKFSFVNPLPKIKSKFENIKNLEGEWFFKENLRKEFFKKELDIDITDEELNELKNKLSALTKKIGNPNPYYALILLDGDNMGKWLSGENLPSIEFAYNSEVWKNLAGDFKDVLINASSQKILTPAIHSAISHALRNYSVEFVRKIVEEEHLGKLVYSGGDDVLAFVNLRDLFPVMRKLRAAFSGHIKIENGRIEVDWENTTGFVEKDRRWLLTMGKNATASMGVVIAHYKMPLRIVFKRLREVEKQSKGIKDKDAFCIALVKHSGGERIGLSNWRFKASNEEIIDVLSYLQKFGKCLRKDASPRFSDKFIYNLRIDFSRLIYEEGRYSGAQGIFDSQLKRVLKRVYNGPIWMKESFIKAHYDFLRELFWESLGGNVNNLLNIIEISAFIEKECI